MIPAPVPLDECDRTAAVKAAGGAHSPACGECCTRIANLSVTIAGTRILDDINLHIHCGEMVTLIGPNGAGKTTLLRVMLGEVPYRGSFMFTKTKAQTHKGPPRIGYVPQQFIIDRTAPVTVLDLFSAALSRLPVWLGHSARVRDEARAQLDAVGSADLLNEPLGTLSGGQLQRVMLSLALTPTPDILLLDEPLASVDAPGTDLFYRTVSELRRTHDLAVIMVSHNLLDAARVSDWIVILNRSILREGPPAQVLANTDVRALFGLDVTPPPPAA